MGMTCRRRRALSSFAFAAGLLSLGSPVFAQRDVDPYNTPTYGLTEAQKRRLHLPYVRAATDCYARAIASNVAALDMAREGRWYDALTATQGVCTQPLLAMAREHDRIYGAGTGVEFFKGPYVADLPRALSTRLKGDIERRTAELARADEAKRKRLETANRTRDLLRDRMYDCTSRELAELVQSSEAAEVLATAAMTICRREVEQALDAAIEVYLADGGTGSIPEFREQLRRTVRTNVVTNAVQARAAVNKPQPSSTEKVAATPPQTQSGAAGILRTTDECLQVASKAREGQFVEVEKLISLMLDLCRPEIEAAARSAFLADPATPLAKARENALEAALTRAKSVVSAP